MVRWAHRPIIRRLLRRNSLRISVKKGGRGAWRPAARFFIARTAGLPLIGGATFQNDCRSLNAPLAHDATPRFATLEQAIERLNPVEPVYVIFPERFKIAAQRFLDSFPGDTLYAVKANPVPAILKQVWAAGIRHFDTASLGEVETVKQLFPEAICHFMAPVRLAGHAKAAFEKYGVTDYVVDCDAELDKLIAETGQPKNLRIFVRIATSLGGAVLELSSKFGSSPEDSAKLLKQVAASGAKPAVTFHVGSQCLSPFSYAQAIEMAARTAAFAKVELQALDIGGGFPGPYVGNDVPPFHWYFDTIKEAMQTLPNPAIPLMCEPGRALSTEGMSLITQVVLRKGQRLYINDGRYGSFDELTQPGFLADYPIRAFARSAKGKVTPLAGKTMPFRVFGPTCDTVDVLPRPLNLPETIATGDFIVFDAMGAYSVSSRSHFNGFYPDSWAVVESA
jgi:ornithine decarboxylase